MQSRRDSLIEVLSNTSIGIVGAYLITVANLYWSPWSASVTALTNVGFCTAWSLVRSYAIRRRFNRKVQSE